MCGIIAYVGQKPALPILLEGLRRLEYRGYDSAGVASLLSTNVLLSESELATRKNNHFLINRTSSDQFPDPLVKAEFYKQEDLEALRLSAESLSQLNKKIEERESTIARIEEELQALQVATEDLYFDKPGYDRSESSARYLTGFSRKDGFSKSELIRQIHR